jgi:hypothetical protein
MIPVPIEIEGRPVRPSKVCIVLTERRPLNQGDEAGCYRWEVHLRPRLHDRWELLGRGGTDRGMGLSYQDALEEAEECADENLWDHGAVQ